MRLYVFLGWGGGLNALPLNKAVMDFKNNLSNNFHLLIYIKILCLFIMPTLVV